MYKAFAFLAIVLFVLSSSFLIYRSIQFDNNYPNPLTDELSAQTIKIKKDINEDYRCFLPPDSGVCRGYIEKYYYDRDLKSCEVYIYGGCGSSVPFNTLKECTSACEKGTVD